MLKIVCDNCNKTITVNATDDIQGGFVLEGTYVKPQEEPTENSAVDTPGPAPS